MQQLLISSSGSAIAFTVTSNQTWLTASIGSGNTGSIGSLNAIVNPNGLSPNTYQGTLTFTPTPGVVQTVNVTLIVTDTGAITASPATLSFSALYQGATPAQQPVNIAAVAGTAVFTVASDSPWLTASAAGGTTPAQIMVTATPGTMAPNTYTGHITATSGTFTAQVTVTFKVVPLTLTVSPPQVTFNSAACGSGSLTQTLQLTSNGAAIDYTVASSAPWLSVSPAGGNSTANPIVSVTFNSALLPASTSPNGTVTFTPAGESPISIPVTVNLAGGPIDLSTGELDYLAVYGINPPSQSISATDVCGNASIQLTSDMQWIAVTQVAGSTPTKAAVAVNVAGLAPGTYSGHVVANTNPGGAPVEALVKVLVQSATVTSNPPALQIAVPGCGSTATVSYQINTNGGAITFAALSNVPWLVPTPVTGVVQPGGTLTATVNASGMAAGTYTGLLTFTQTGAPQLLIPLSLTVGATNALAITPASFNFSAPSGTTATTQILTVGGACGTPTFTVTTDQPWLTAATTIPGQIVVTASAATLGQGTVMGNVIVTAPGATNSPISIPVTFVVGPPAAVITAVVNAASMQGGPLAGGTLFTVFGSNLAGGTSPMGMPPYPTTLGDVSMTMGGLPVPLLYVSPTQINAQVPYELTQGTAQLIASINGTALAPFPIQITNVSPGLFILPNTQGHAAVENQDFSVNTPGNPVTAGGVIFAYFTGQGALNNPVADGAAAPANPLATALATASATIGGQPAMAIFTGMTPGYAGLAQMNISVPNLAPGNYPLILAVGGVLTNSGIVNVGQ